MATRLYVLAYPDLPPAHLEWIEDVRRRHDPEMAGRVAAHFTLVFGLSGIAEAEFQAHVHTVAGRTAPFPVTLNTLRPDRDHASGVGLVFLTPGRGAGALHNLHDRLNAGPLAAMRQTAIAFEPHVTLGRTARAGAAARLCDALQPDCPQISGHVRALTIVRETGRRIDEVAVIPLSAPLDGNPRPR